MRAGKENGLIFPNTMGTSGQTLVTNGSGGFTWGTPLTLAGDAGDILFNSGSAIGAAQFVNVENGYLKLMTGLPSVGGSGGAILGSKDLGTRMMPAFVGPNGLDTTIQPHMGRNKIYMINPTVGSAAATSVGGMPAPTLVNAVARTPASTNMLTSINRVGFMTSTTSATYASIRTTIGMWMRGTANGIGGFHMQVTFGIADTAVVSTKRMFIGLYANTAVITATTEPTAFLNMVGIGKISSSTNLMIMSNAGSGTGTAVDLGSNYPATTAGANPVYLLTLFSPAGGSFIGWRVDRLDTGITTSGTITASAALPVNTTMMNFQAYANNNGLSLATGFDLSNFYLETDN